MPVNKMNFRQKKNINDPRSEALDIFTVKAFIQNSCHEYLTTHQVVCFAIIKRIYRRVLAGYRFGSIKVNNDELVTDGNHRYIAYKLAGIAINTVKSGCSFSDIRRSFKDIKIDTIEDWDYNCPYNRKYCNDDFLSDFEKIN
ncbi:hypothetical protein [Flavobacterium supellecticarium]|uniref:hypothetical protein n=1 Tax=Flavobacterium supellecticarium TaxID=2565924 RepID=UPI001E621AF4|nr:hypothetical protein [Flavobacterium supellecticarium]